MSDWTTDAADAIDRAVGLVRDRTVEPAQAAVKAAVFGVLAGLVALPALLLVTIGLFRGLVIVEGGYPWIAWCTLGGIFLVAGAFCWTKRTP